MSVDKTQILRQQEVLSTLPLLLGVGMICIALKRALGKGKETEQAEALFFFFSTHLLYIT